MHRAFKSYRHPFINEDALDKAHSELTPTQMRWAPLPHSEGKSEVDFVDGLATMSGAGDPAMKSGIAIHVYRCNASMNDRCMANADGDFLIVPQEGELHIRTEVREKLHPVPPPRWIVALTLRDFAAFLQFGLLDVRPQEICVIQRGMRFNVAVDGPSRGYICEVYAGHFRLPDLGPIGANGLANPRDFLHPVAAYEERTVEYEVIHKYGGAMWTAQMHHSPFDVVAWHGNYVPYKYHLGKFNCMNSVTFDHPDPSIYTVLTVPSDTPGVAVCDFVIFPPRWMVMDHSFRPPYFHRNTMSEFMGMIYGSYDAKVGFRPGGASLHSCMSAHGPDADTFHKASAADLGPAFFDGGLAFMFETNYMMRLTKWATEADHREKDYHHCWQEMPKLFDGKTRDASAALAASAAAAAAGAGGAGGAAAEKGSE